MPHHVLHKLFGSAESDDPNEINLRCRQRSEQLVNRHLDSIFTELNKNLDRTLRSGIQHEHPVTSKAVISGYENMLTQDDRQQFKPPSPAEDLGLQPWSQPKMRPVLVPAAEQQIAYMDPEPPNRRDHQADIIPGPPPRPRSPERRFWEPDAHPDFPPGGVTPSPEGAAVVIPEFPIESFPRTSIPSRAHVPQGKSGHRSASRSKRPRRNKTLPKLPLERGPSSRLAPDRTGAPHSPYCDAQLNEPPVMPRGASGQAPRLHRTPSQSTFRSTSTSEYRQEHKEYLLGLSYHVVALIRVCRKKISAEVCMALVTETKPEVDGQC